MVVQVVNTLDANDGGPARNSYELSRALGSTIFSFQPPRGRQVVDVGAERVVYRRPATEGREWFSWYRKIYRSARSGETVIIHGYYLKSSAWAAIICFLARVRPVIVPHGVFTRHQQSYSRGKKRVYEFFLGYLLHGRCQAFAVGSQVEADDLHLKFKKASVVVTGVGTNFEVSSARLRPSGRRIRLLSLSRIARKKRIDVSIEALAYLRNQGFDAELAVAGHGDPSIRKNLEALVADLNLSSFVHFIGQVVGDKKISVYDQADVFLLPSEDENFGIVVAEALARALPVVTTEATAASMYVRSGAGRVLASSDPRQVAEAVLEIFEGRNYETASAEAVSVAAGHLSWGVVAKRWNEELGVK